MKIEESELRKILAEAFEAGYYGCKDLQENVIEELVDRVKESNPKEASPETISISSNFVGVDGSAMPFLMHVNPPPVNPADRRTWNQPNRNNDVFITGAAGVPAGVPADVEINVETTRIEASPNPFVQEAIREMQAQEDSRFFAHMEELTGRVDAIARARSDMEQAGDLNEENDNPTV